MNDPTLPGHQPSTCPTLKLSEASGYDFDHVLPIRRVEDFEDEPTLPLGLCQTDWLEDEVTEVDLPEPRS